MNFGSEVPQIAVKDTHLRSRKKEASWCSNADVLKQMKFLPVSAWGSANQFFKAKNIYSFHYWF